MINICVNEDCSRYNHSGVDVRFCPACGKAMTEVPKCKHCEEFNIISYIFPGNNFCEECGRPAK